MTKKILITGSTGFIGNALTKFFNEQNNYVIYPVSRQNGIDLTTTDWIKCLPNEDIDTVIHLAQSHRYRDFPEGAEDMRKINIDATAELLNWSRLHNVKRFIFASTGNVYQSSSDGLRESDSVEPNSFYGASKLCAEKLIAQYNDYFSTVSMRLFGVYGPNQKSMMIPSLIKRLKNKEEITLAQKKGLIYTPLYIDDCIQIINFIVTTQRENLKANLILNVAGKEVCSLSDVVSKLAQLISVEPEIRYTNDSINYFIANIDLLLKLIPEQKFTSIEEGLTKTVGSNS